MHGFGQQNEDVGADSPLMTDVYDFPNVFKAFVICEDQVRIERSISYHCGRKIQSTYNSRLDTT
jgi:hypothetical protein